MGEFTRSFSYNAANELTEIIEGSQTTSFTYDALGRQTGKSRGSYSASYGYRYGARLYDVATNFPGEQDVTFEYAGDGTRRLKLMAGGDEIYRWDPLRGNLMHREEGVDHAETFVHDPGGCSEAKSPRPTVAAAKQRHERAARLGGSLLAQISFYSAGRRTPKYILKNHMGSMHSNR